MTKTKRKPFPPGTRCRSKLGCNALAKPTHRRTPLCPKHHRFGMMREIAKAARKRVPSYEELESLLAQLKDLKCPVCNRVMVWFKHESDRTVITLQHNRDGSIALICFSCNSRHRDNGDALYQIGPDQKRCSRCKRVLPLSGFTSDRTSGVWANRKCVCKTCANAYRREWAAKNRHKIRAWNKAAAKRRSER